MTLGPCRDCSTPTRGSRCPDCQRPRDRQALTRKRAARPYTSAMRRARAAAVHRHRAAYGDICPGWKREEHASADLTADHPVAVADGGAEDGPLEVLCRACNAAKGGGRR